MQVIVDGLLTHYERSGKGPVVLVIPGWADTTVSWKPLRQLLSRNYDVIAIDLPGFGGSQAPQVAWGLDEYAAFVGGFLRKVAAGKLCAVIGHSNGGAIAIKGVAGSKLETDKLVLLASAGIRGEQNGRKKALAAVAKSGRLLTRPLPVAIRQKLRQKLYTAAGSDLLVAEHMQETFKRVVSEDVQSCAPQIKVPTLLIYGDKDTAAPLRFGRMYQSLIPGSRLETIPGADHFLHVENYSEVGKHVEAFLS